MSEPVDLNSEELNDASFEVGASFDRSNGRLQTRMFAEAFCRHVKVQLKPDFSMLDVGCALGDALPVWRRHYPRAQLSGCDFSGTAIRRCKETYGDIAQFYRARFEDIREDYDIIYCSNVLEHFADYLRIAELLLQRCTTLYVLVPYMEMRHGMPLSADTTDYYHKATFDLSSFNPLASPSRSVSGKVIRAPLAWSPTAMGELRWLVRRWVLGRPGSPPRQALFEIERHQ